MCFASDNWAGVHPAIAESLARHSTGYNAPYGESEYDRSVAAQFSKIFERDVAVFFVATGTAANAMALTAIAKPGGLVFAHRDAHAVIDECGAPEYLSSGQLRFVPVEGSLGKIDASRLHSQMAELGKDGNLLSGRPNAICVTQATESGTVYSLEELDALAAVAQAFNIPLHMDGARFANALVALDCTPAQMTWKRGVRSLSFGATKNGCWCGEAVILFDTTAADDFAFVRKRAAQLFSKSRFLSAQFEAYLHDDLWLQLARHANARAVELAHLFAGTGSTRLAWVPQTNEVFVIMPKQISTALQTDGFEFYDWNAPTEIPIADTEQLCRFVTSFATTSEDVQKLRSALQIREFDLGGADCP